VRVIVLAANEDDAEHALPKQQFRQSYHVSLRPLAYRSGEIDQLLDRMFAARDASYLRTADLLVENQEALRAYAWPKNLAQLHTVAEAIVAHEAHGGLRAAGRALGLAPATMHGHLARVGLKARKIVTVHDGSPYAQQLTVVTATNFTKLGGTVLSQEAIAPTDVDMHPLLTRVATEKPDVLYFPVFVAGAAQILRQVKDTPGLENTALIGGGSLMAPDMIKAAGAAVVGFRIAYPDVSPAAMGKTYPKFLDEYKKAYGEGPISGFHGQAYDAAQLLMKAIQKVAVTDQKTGATYIGRKALRDAVFATKFDGVSGPIACDAHGECGEFKPAVYEYTSADAATFAIGKNPKRIYP